MVRVFDVVKVLAPLADVIIQVGRSALHAIGEQYHTAKVSFPMLSLASVFVPS